LNKYLYFFLRLGILLVIVGILDYAIGSALRYYYFKQTQGKQYRTTVSMEQTKAEVLIFGSSRANHHYSPAQIGKQLNNTVYNAGRDGQYLFYHYAVLKSILKRYRPNLVILEFQRGEFSKNQESYDMLSSLLPYYADHPEIRQVIDLKGPYEKIKLLSRIYPYNSTVLSIAGGMDGLNKRKETTNMGYVPLTNTWQEPLKAEGLTHKPDADPVKIKVFNSFIDDCKKLGIEIVIVCSPYFIKFTRYDESIMLAKKIAARKDIRFYDFSNDSYFLNQKNLFSDPLHLNYKGAEYFTRKLLDTMARSGTITVKHN